MIPLLRSLRGGAVGDRWALGVAGHFPVAEVGERYVIAALKYVIRYPVARSVTQYTAERVATFLMEDVVLKFGTFLGTAQGRRTESDGACNRAASDPPASEPDESGAISSADDWTRRAIPSLLGRLRGYLHERRTHCAAELPKL